ncbi:MAG: DUF1499 domain-containing protein [Thiothrix sp.]|nr:DUF1499 domain-containing protein [Thiothrix sp.]HPQ95819.1 DUF1499 domain-containing protein [Thiolinea sp.]
MKVFGLLVLILVTVGVVSLLVLGIQSRQGQPPGLLNGHLRPCVDKPNCVCSETGGNVAHSVPPIPVSGFDSGLLARVEQAVADMGGRVEQAQDNYLAATFRSAIFGFVDDLELRLDSRHAVLHVRSASRVGYSDLGVNRKRVKELRRRLMTTGETT